MKQVGVAAEVQSSELAKCLLCVMSGPMQLTQCKQAAGSIEQQHGSGRIHLRESLQRLIDKGDTVIEIAAKKCQPAAQECERLM
ncbi:hypothetical protein D3C71_1722750 [compost metagenome]